MACKRQEQIGKPGVQWTPFWVSFFFFAYRAHVSGKLVCRSFERSRILTQIFILNVCFNWRQKKTGQIIFTFPLGHCVLVLVGYMTCLQIKRSFQKKQQKKMVTWQQNSCSASSWKLNSQPQVFSQRAICSDFCGTAALWWRALPCLLCFGVFVQHLCFHFLSDDIWWCLRAF